MLNIYANVHLHLITKFPSHDKQLTVLQLAVCVCGRGGGVCERGRVCGRGALPPPAQVGVAGVSLGRVQQEL